MSGDGLHGRFHLTHAYERVDVPTRIRSMHSFRPTSLDRFSIRQTRSASAPWSGRRHSPRCAICHATSSCARSD